VKRKGISGALRDNRQKEETMQQSSLLKRPFSIIASAIALCLISGLGFAQTHPQLFRQRPTPSAPGQHATLAQTAEVDEQLLSTGPQRLAISVPGKPDLLIERDLHQRRGPGSMVWRGRAQNDPSSRVTLTMRDGILLGHIQSGNEVFSIRPGANGRTVIEKLDPDSFPPEWGHDHATHGHEKVPPASAPDANQSSGTTTSTTTAAAADGTVQIALMSVYTPQARAAAGGTAQIQAQLQAAVDQANSAFINSNMTARYFLTHTEEVAYNDSGDISVDLNWVTGNATVASLRNTYGADMVSLIVSNGGSYCGIGWVQRSPGASFANYAFQVTAQNCLSNQTLAHEHGHNLGMEHDPANAGIAPTSASYVWSFGHNVPGSFRTIMSYACPSPCPRILHFSNPDVLYNGQPTGIANQRDNAQTGDLIAPIVAAFRAGSVANNPPAFSTDPIVKANATQSQAYSSTLAGSASDPDADPLTFAKTAGPAWLTIAANGTLSGTPTPTDIGLNTFTVTVSDGRGGSDTATLQITVVAPIAAPTNLSVTAL
jgi:peptidyl-Asp metalloendopeptidase